MRKSYATLFTKYQDSNVISKCTQYARFTIAHLMAGTLADGTPSSKNGVERDYQEIGALLVNGLSTKLTGLLFPNRPFYKIKVSKAVRERAKERGKRDTEVNAGLARLEVESCQQLFLNASYAQLIMTLKHLIVTGNALLHRDPAKQSTTVYGVNRFGIKRDGRGSVLDCVLQESIDISSLSLDIQMALRVKNPGKYTEDRDDTAVRLYTRIERIPGMGAFAYRVSQQADDIDVGTPSIYPEHLNPWMFPTWSLIAGEHYGRGLVEDYAGGFAKLSDVSHSSALYLVAASKFLNLVAPGSGADVDDMNKAETGEYVAGTSESVKAHEAGDSRKMAQLREEVEAIFGRLARAFMYKANTRDAERVTAFELRQDAMEAEQTLGGAYSTLSACLQVPLAHLLLTEADSSTLEGIITKDLKLDISAGIPALGRQSDVQNLVNAAQEAGAIIPTLTQLDGRVSKEKLMDVILAGQSVDSAAIFKTADELAAEQDANKLEAQGNAQLQNSTTMADQAAQLQQLGT